jgi:hypothetical protein
VNIRGDYASAASAGFNHRRAHADRTQSVAGRMKGVTGWAIAAISLFVAAK